MQFDLASFLLGFVPGVLAAGAYAYTHAQKLNAIAADVKGAVAGITTFSTAAAQEVDRVVVAAKNKL